MNWEAIGAFGEIFGGLAVLFTLLYLAVQVRQNTQQQKREELISIQHGQNAVVSQLLDPDVFGGYVRSATDQNPTIEDRGRAFAWVIQYLNQFQIVHTLYRNGAIDEEQYQLWAGFAVGVVAPPGIRRWWDEENGRIAFQAEVRDLIDARLADSEDPPWPVTELWSQFNGEAWAKAANRGTAGGNHS